MHARHYEPTQARARKELFDVLEKKKADVEKLLRAVKGFVSYSLVRTSGGGLSVSVYPGQSRRRRERSGGPRVGR